MCVHTCMRACVSRLVLVPSELSCLFFINLDLLKKLLKLGRVVNASTWETEVGESLSLHIEFQDS